MSDNNDKVIDFLKRMGSTTAGLSGRGDKSGSIKDKFPFIKLIKDANGNYYSKEALREYSKKVCYIVTVMKENPPSVALYKYTVPQSYLVEFLYEFSKKNSDGEIIDIEKYIPENLA